MNPEEILRIESRKETKGQIETNGFLIITSSIGPIH